ncbi:MAG: AEC family transporter, partial [Butyricicoccaceae bacterium]
FTQASCRGSAAVLGIAFVNNIYGNSGLTPLMIVAAVPLFNIFSVVILTLSSEQSSALSGRQAIKKSVLGILKNPIILSILAGLPFSLLGITIPQIPLNAIDSVGSTATPIALLTVGAGFQGAKALKKLKPTIAASFIKLVLLPAIFLPIAAALGFRETEMIAILIMVGAPTTVTCYIMARNMGNDAELSSSVIVLATLLSSVTLTFWIFLLSALHLI